MNINISIVFCQNLISSRYIYFNYQQGVLATGSLVSSLVGSFSSSLSLGSSSSGYRYSFTAMVLKLVGLLSSYTLYISLLILSNLNRLVYLPLYLILPSRYISTSKLRGRLQIIVIDRLFYQFSVLLTYFFTLILAISSITFFIATACCIIEVASRSSSLI